MLQGMFGKRLAEHFSLLESSSLVLGPKGNSQVALTRMRMPNGFPGPTPHIPPEKVLNKLPAKSNCNAPKTPVLPFGCQMRRLELRTQTIGDICGWQESRTDALRVLARRAIRAFGSATWIESSRPYSRLYLGTRLPRERECHGPRILLTQRPSAFCWED